MTCCVGSADKRGADESRFDFRRIWVIQRPYRATHYEPIKRVPRFHGGYGRLVGGVLGSFLDVSASTATGHLAFPAAPPLDDGAEGLGSVEHLPQCPWRIRALKLVFREQDKLLAF